ncbi:MAG: hypothetical protein ACXWPM_03825, partial [Bdellovibrionota bacterium]
MVILKHLSTGVLFLWLSVPSAFSAPTVPDFRVAARGASESLRQCELTRATFWANALEPGDHEAAVLYRLAALQAGQATPHDLSAPTSAEELTWKWDGELWADEGPRPIGLCEATDVELSKLPQEIVSSLLNPWLSKYATVGPELRAALRSYAFHEWQAGRTIDFPAGAAPKSLKLEDRCDWRALQLLHSPKAREASELLSIVEDCSRSTDPLWAAIEAQAGDALLKTGNAVEAYRRYLGLTRNFYVHRAIPLTLDYRLAAAGLLASETSPAAWRALYRSLHSEDESALDPIYRTALEELACSEIETLSPKSVQRLLREVFQPTTYFTQSVQLTRKCHRAVGFWKTLVSEAETPRDRTELYGLLLRGSLEQSRSSDARIYVQKIAAISREIPIVTSHVF